MMLRFSTLAAGLGLGLVLMSGCGDDAPSGGPGGSLDAGVRLDGSSQGDARNGSDADVTSDGATGTADSARCAAEDEALPPTSATHINGEIAYPDVPPAGGNHNGCWARWGAYDSELADERWVHNLEHGGVVFLYRCPEGCADEVAQLTAFVGDHVQTIVSPYAALGRRFAAVSWGYRVTTDCFDMARFERFYDEHKQRAPEQIESNPPASCL